MGILSFSGRPGVKKLVELARLGVDHQDVAIARPAWSAFDGGIAGNGVGARIAFTGPFEFHVHLRRARRDIHVWDAVGGAGPNRAEIRVEGLTRSGVGDKIGRVGVNRVAGNVGVPRIVRGKYRAASVPSESGALLGGG